LHRTEDALHRTEDALHRTEDALHRTEDALHRTEDALRAMKLSLTWRLTRPLHRLLDAIRFTTEPLPASPQYDPPEHKAN